MSDNEARDVMLAKIADVLGVGDGPGWPADLPERVQALVASRDWWKKAAEHNLGKWSEATAWAEWLLAETRWERDQARIAATARRAERDEARAEADDLRTLRAHESRSLPIPDAENPAHLQWAADLIAIMNSAGFVSQHEPWNPAELRGKADRLEIEASARSRRDSLTTQATEAFGDAVHERLKELRQLGVDLGAVEYADFSGAIAAVVDVVLAEVAE